MTKVTIDGPAPDGARYEITVTKEDGKAELMRCSERDVMLRIVGRAFDATPAELAVAAAFPERA